jgi:hypothetical protein
MSRSARTKRTPRAARTTTTRTQDTGGTAASVQQISVWEDDAESAVQVSRPLPDPSKSPLAYDFSGNAPAPGGKPGTASFRYWTAAEALRRGADFWAPRVPSGKWEVGDRLPVLLDEGVDLNAYYDRQALNFFHGPAPSAPSHVAYSGESPDVVCHEMGHAILDAIKPQLWSAASHEAAAFHESFGDMSAILSALQLQSLRSAILQDTGGNLYRNSRLSRLAEQLGSAIRAQHPDAVDPDCLRNAVNSFTYQDPVTLPQMAPASQLSSEPHSFSRVFTGAFFEALAGMLHAKAANPASPTEQELLAVSQEMGDILVAGARQAPVVSNFYAQVATGMVQASGSKNSAYPPIFKGVFVRRSILSLQAATTVEALHQSFAAAAIGPAEAAGPTDALDTMALPAALYGLDQPLLVETPSQPRRIFAASAAPDASSIDPASSVTAARAFVDDLFRRGRVDYNGVGRPEARLEHGHRLRSHELVSEAGAVRLRRRLFDCGIRHS